MTTYVSAGFVYGGTQVETVVANWARRCQAVADALTFVGMVQTADTGQLDIAALASIPTGTNSAGFHIYRFNDSVQATYPLFVKVTFKNNGNTGIWGMNIQTGTGTNGAGTLTGTVSPVKAAGSNSWNSQNITLNSCQVYACCVDGFLLLLFGPNTPVGAGPMATFSVSRSRDSGGAFDGVGHVLWTDEGNFTSVSQLAFVRTLNSQFAGNSNSHFCIAPGHPAPPRLLNGDALLYPHFYADPDPKQMWSQFTIYGPDMPAPPATFTATPMYGTARTFLTSASFPRGELNNSNFRIAYLWE